VRVSILCAGRSRCVNGIVRSSFSHSPQPAIRRAKLCSCRRASRDSFVKIIRVLSQRCRPLFPRLLPGGIGSLLGRSGPGARWGKLKLNRFVFYLRRYSGWYHVSRAGGNDCSDQTRKGHPPMQEQYAPQQPEPAPYYRHPVNLGSDLTSPAHPDPWHP